MWPPGVKAGLYWAVITFTQQPLFIHLPIGLCKQVHINLKLIPQLFRDHFKFPPNLNELNRKLPDLISNLIFFTFRRKNFFFFFNFPHYSISTRAPCQLHIANASIFIIKLSLICRCGECCGGGPGPCRDQTLPGFPDAQQNMDSSMVPSAGLHQQRKQGRVEEAKTQLYQVFKT